MSSEQINTKASRTVMIMAITATFASLAFGYDTGVINGALPYMAEPDQLNLTPALEGLVVSAICIGAAFGSALGGRISDILGRKPALTYLSILFFISTLGCALSINATMIIIFRFTLGLAVGSASTIVPAYLAEIATGNLRGSLVVLMELVIVSGQLLAYIVNAIIAITLGHDPHVWRYILAIAAIPAILLFFGMLVNKESPRWLVAKGKTSEALDVLRLTHESEAKAIAELNDIQDLLAEQSIQQNLSFKDFTEPWMKKVLLIGIGVAILQQTTGVNTIMFYGSQILTKSGFSTDAALIGNIGNGIISVIGTLFGFTLVRRLTRRKMLTIGLIGILFANTCIGTISNIMAGSPNLPYFVLSLTITFLFFQQTFVSPVTWVYMSEIFPLRMRGTALGIAVFFLWGSNFCIQLLFPILMNTFGLSNTFYIFSSIGILSLLFTKFIMPETKGLSIEDIERKFRHDYK